MRCPCHSGEDYAVCCQPHHAGLPASTPAALMRSRYAAYALGLVDYIVATTDPAGPQWVADATAWRTSILTFSRGTRFEALELLSASADHVVFRAGLRQGGRDASFVEDSRFTRVNGRWCYHSGVPVSPR